MKHDACKFQKKEYYDDKQDDETIIRYPYHSCKLEIEGLPCPYPVRHCSFKQECEDTEDLIALENGDIIFIDDVGSEK